MKMETALRRNLARAIWHPPPEAPEHGASIYELGILVRYYLLVNSTLLTSFCFNLRCCSENLARDLDRPE